MLLRQVIGVVGGVGCYGITADDLMSELIATVPPVLPIGNGLLRHLVARQWHELRKWYSKLALVPSYPHEGFSLADILWRHCDHLNPVAGAERRGWRSLADLSFKRNCEFASR